MMILLVFSILCFAGIQATAETMDCSRFANDDYTCMVCNCYHESKGEPQEGRIAVTKAVLSRRGKFDFPQTACGVVFMRGQFNWVDDEYSNTIVANTSEKMQALVECRAAVKTALKEGPNGLIFFYNPKKSTPGWATQHKYCGSIQNHAFLVPRNQKCPAKLGSNGSSRKTQGSSHRVTR